jgi:hypothetical protein
MGAQTRHVFVEIANKKFEVQIVSEFFDRTGYENMQYRPLEEVHGALKHCSFYPPLLDFVFLNFNDPSPDASD